MDRSYSDQGIADFLWSLTIIAALSPEIILTATSLLKIRNARARHAARGRPQAPWSLMFSRIILSTATVIVGVLLALQLGFEAQPVAPFFRRFHCSHDCHSDRP